MVARDRAADKSRGFGPAAIASTVDPCLDPEADEGLDCDASSAAACPPPPNLPPAPAAEPPAVAALFKADEDETEGKEEGAREGEEGNDEPASAAADVSTSDASVASM